MKKRSVSLTLLLCVRFKYDVKGFDIFIFYIIIDVKIRINEVNFRARKRQDLFINIIK